MRRWVVVLGVVPALLALLLALGKQGEKTADDAYILFRYAESLVAGHGLTFNPGERVEGYSSLSFVLLLALGDLCGLGPVLTSNVVNLAAVVIATWATFQLAAGVVGSPPWAQLSGGLCAGLLVAMSDGFVSYGLLGMETAFAGALLSLALLADAAARQSPDGLRPALISGVLFGLFAVTRPEGISAYAAAVLGGLLALGLRREAARASLAVGIPLAQLLFRIVYYGELAPNTYHAKIWASWDRYFLGGHYVAAFLRGLGWPLLAVSAVGILRAIAGGAWRRGGPIFAVAAAGSAFGIYSGGDLFPASRLLVPTFPALAAVLGAACALALSGLGARFGSTLVALVVAVSVCFSGYFSVWRRDSTPPAAIADRIAANVQSLAEPMETLQVKVGRFLGEKLPPGASLTVGDCGRIPYFSRLRVVDSLGLMDPVVARSPGAKDQKLAVAYLLGRDTDYFLLRLAPLERYPAPGGLRIDHLMAHRVDFQRSHELRAYFPWSGNSAYYLFGREVGVTDLTDALPGATEGRVASGADEDVLSPVEAQRVIAEITAHPFELLPAGGEISRRARLLWPCKALGMRGEGASFTYGLSKPAQLETALDAPDAEIVLTDGSGIPRRLTGRDLVVTVILPAGQLRIRLARGEAATLIAPRLRQLDGR